jgi:hypothetical protein
MNSHLVPDRALSRDSGRRDLPARATAAEVALPGSIGDLVARAEGRPIYCTPAPGVRRALMAAVGGSFCRDFPSVEFVNALDVWRPRDYLRWRAERDRYGAGIVVTSTHTQSASRLAEVAGEHVIGIYASIEIESLARLGRPVAWLAVVFPYRFWVTRFAI